MSVVTKAQYRNTRSPDVTNGLDYAQVDRYLDIARQMRAQAMADMVRKALGALARLTHIAPSVPQDTTAHTA